MADEDLLAGDDADNQQDTTATDDSTATDDFQAGPPPSDVKYPDWVPSEYQDPDKRGELLDALGVKQGKSLPTERPDWVPEKFWDEKDGLQLENAMKSYAEMERKQSEGRPQPPENYEIKAPEGIDLGDDAPMVGEEDTALFKDLGLDNESAQKVVDHFWTNVLPVVAEARGEAELANLSAAWDMKAGEDGKPPPEFKERLGKIREWGKNNLPEEVQQHLRKSASGVQAMWKMMESGTAAPAQGAAAGMSKEELESEMLSDMYWTDEAHQQRISQEFQRRYG